MPDELARLQAMATIDQVLCSLIDSERERVVRWIGGRWTCDNPNPKPLLELQAGWGDA